MTEKKSAWKQWKENLGDTRPWDFVNPNTEYVSEQASEERLSICKSCPRFISATTQCMECGCFMAAKTKLSNAECPLHKWNKRNDYADKTIFINIPSYKDPELFETIDDFLAKAKHPERVFFGITNQYIDLADDLKKYEKYGPNVGIDFAVPGSVVGCQPGRLNSHGFYKDQDFYMNMDSHMRAVPEWDVLLINELLTIESKHGPSVITGYVIPYEKNEDGSDSIPPGIGYPLIFNMTESNTQHFYNFGVPQFTPKYKSTKTITPSPYISGHFFFTTKQAILDAPFVKEITFTEEEIFMALRFYTAGYNLFNPSGNYVYHRYGRGGRALFWDDFPEAFFPSSDSSMKHMVKVVTENIINKDYGLLDKRTLQEFEEYSGINFKNRTLTDSVINGLD
jgi:hypothetical protein